MVVRPFCLINMMMMMITQETEQESDECAIVQRLRSFVTGWLVSRCLVALSVQIGYTVPRVYEIYTVSQIKTPMRTIVHNFVKFLPIFTIF